MRPRREELWPEKGMQGQRIGATSAPAEELEHDACAVACAQGSASEVAGAGVDQAKKNFSTSTLTRLRGWGYSVGRAPALQGAS